MILPLLASTMTREKLSVCRYVTVLGMLGPTGLVTVRMFMSLLPMVRQSEDRLIACRLTRVLRLGEMCMFLLLIMKRCELTMMCPLLSESVTLRVMMHLILVRCLWRLRRCCLVVCMMVWVMGRGKRLLR